MRLKVDVAMQAQESVKNDSVNFESNFRQNVERLTRGVIKSYRITDRKVSQGSGQLCITVDAVIPTYRQSEQLKRLKLVVVPVVVHPQLSSNANARKFADSISASLEAHLTSTRRFAMLDRRHGAHTQKELNQIISGATPIEDTVKLGMTAGADYIVLASLRDFSVQSVEGKSPLGRSATRLVAPVAVDVRILDIATRQIKFARAYTNRGRLPSGYGLSEHAQDVGHEIGETISTAIFPTAVVAVTGNFVTLNQGGDTVQVGRRYRLVVLGRKIIDPHTKESLGNEEVEVGIVEVTSVTDRTAQARLAEGNLGQVSGEMLVRPAHGEFIGLQANQALGPLVPAAASDKGKPKSDDW